MKKKLPAEIYVVWDEPGDGESYLLAAEKPTEHAQMGTKKLVGTYKLVFEDEVQGVPQWKRVRKHRG